MIETKDGKQLYVVGPCYETVQLGMDNPLLLSCEIWPGDELKKCRINGRYVSEKAYRQAKAGLHS